MPGPLLTKPPWEVIHLEVMIGASHSPIFKDCMRKFGVRRMTRLVRLSSFSKRARSLWILGLCLYIPSRAPYAGHAAAAALAPLVLWAEHKQGCQQKQLVIALLCPCTPASCPVCFGPP